MNKITYGNVAVKYTTYASTDINTDTFTRLISTQHIRDFLTMRYINSLLLYLLLLYLLYLLSGDRSCHNCNSF